jgi:hypothetical protein
MPVQTIAVLDIDDLDLTRCVVADDAILERGDSLTLYARHGRSVREIGRFVNAADAMDALDVLDVHPA